MDLRLRNEHRGRRVLVQLLVDEAAVLLGLDEGAGDAAERLVLAGCGEAAQLAVHGR